MESGEFKKRNLPYGYRWDEEHSNMVFDEETAPIVRKIFQWKIEGLSLPAIADRLDAMNAPNPEFQKYQVGVRTGNATAKKIWNKSSLTTILDNPHYVGDTVLGRTLNAIYKGVKNQHIDREEWIVFPNTHEAIISREDFQKVREMRNAAARTRVEKMERTEEIRATLINLFEDKIVCADCGKSSTSIASALTSARTAHGTPSMSAVHPSSAATSVRRTIRGRISSKPMCLRRSSFKSRRLSITTSCLPN